MERSENSMITFTALLYGDGPKNSEDLLDIIGDNPPQPDKQVEMSLSIISVEKYYESPDFNGLTEICTIEGELITVDEEFDLFDQRFKIESGQEPRETWTAHRSKDGFTTIRTYNN